MICMADTFGYFKPAVAIYQIYKLYLGIGALKINTSNKYNMTIPTTISIIHFMLLKLK